MNKIKRKRILESAERLFNRFGIRKTAVDEIAETANVAKGTIYNNFGDKEGIVKELIREKIGGMFENARKAPETLKDPLLRLQATLLERVRVFAENPFLRDRSLHRDQEAMLLIEEELDRKSSDVISGILDDAIGTGEPEADRNKMLRTILFTLKGMETSLRNHVEPLALSRLEEEIEYLLGLMFSRYRKKTDCTEVGNHAPSSIDT